MIKTKYIIFDMEMLGLKKSDGTLSIGAVTEDDQCFYAEISDFDKSSIGDWIKENVIANFIYNHVERFEYVIPDKHSTYKLPFIEVGEKFNEWIQDVSKGYDKIQFVADVSHYDFVHLIDMITNKGSALDLDSKIIPDVINISQYLLLPNVRKELNIDDSEIAFDVSREGLYEYITGESSNHDSKHNALHDAFMCLIIFIKIKEILGLE